MSSETRIVKNFYTDITSCKDFSVAVKDLCVISRGGKFGVAEKHGNGKLTVLIGCEYDYVDTFCSEKGFTNMVSVLLENKWGLYVFKWTVSTKSQKINCERITPCEYDGIHTVFGNCLAVLEKNDRGIKYYNIFSGKLSPTYNGYSEESEGLCCFFKGNSQKWIDCFTDSVIYESSANNLIVPEKIFSGFYVMTHYVFDDSPIEKNENDLIFHNHNLRTSYLICNVSNLKITTYDYDKWTLNYVATFLKNGEKYVIATTDSHWDFDEIRKIAKEVDYT